MDQPLAYDLDLSTRLPSTVRRGGEVPRTRVPRRLVARGGWQQADDGRMADDGHGLTRRALDLQVAPASVPKPSGVIGIHDLGSERYPPLVLVGWVILRRCWVSLRTPLEDQGRVMMLSTCSRIGYRRRRSPKSEELSRRNGLWSNCDITKTTNGRVHAGGGRTYTGSGQAACARPRE